MSKGSKSSPGKPSASKPRNSPRKPSRQDVARAQARTKARRAYARYGLLGVAALATVVSLVVALVVHNRSQGEHLSPSAFASYAASATLVDVRTPAEFASGHLAGATNVDVEAADFRTRIAGMDHNAVYAVYCHSGNRSQVALQLMQADGFTHVKDLAGGITAWIQAGRPTTTT